MLSRLGLGLGLVQGSIQRSAGASSVVLSRVLYSSSSVVAPLNEPNEVFVKYGNPTPEEHSFAPALGYVPDVKVRILAGNTHAHTIEKAYNQASFSLSFRFELCNKHQN